MVSRGTSTGEVNSQPTRAGVRTLVLGGVRSGKSGHGESLLRAHTEVRYLATGPTTSTDAEWVARVAAHRQRRDERYTTLETIDIGGALRSDPHTPTLIDDLGTWLAAELDALGGWGPEPVDLAELRATLCAAIASFTGDLVIISPEAGLSLVPPTPAGRRFQDELGTLNEAVAAACDRVVLVVAGRVVELPANAEAAAPTPVTPVVSSPPSPLAPRPAPGRPERTKPETPAEPGANPTTAPQKSSSVDPTDAEVFETVATPDLGIARAARERHLTLTKPAGSLGRMEDIGVWLASCQGVCPPRPVSAPTVAVFAGDHGVARSGVSAFPPEVTAQMVANIAGGGAAVNVLARRSGATVHVFDMSVDADTAPDVSRFKVRRSSGDLTTTDALSLAEARTALAAGRAIADELVDSGADLLIGGEMGIGNTTPATVLIGTLSRREPVEIVGRGTGIDDAGWIRKTAAIRDGMRRARRHVHDPLSLLASVAGADLTALAGFLAQAAVRRTPVILDGMVVTAAAMVAAELAPGASRWWLAGHRSVEPAHTIALHHLDLEPVLDLSMRLGEGSGALAALPLVASAVDILSTMATFDEAGVSDRDASPTVTDSPSATAPGEPSPTAVAVTR
ncbi:nicotinate-nucleotide--dimethylbenzimidazole phosphoribosyltransferase [Gordonia aquimaris]|uniref:Nicotinate-nucleotide--dimethylbenzimidazole phosphoribosyltransferase n=1 Tax=Gordonia aquimaris TaxID=2984863 RepID=A0A9X3D2M5_9ACTN|nr:nicotinate-nucleotide--dimethylbenzimidazole phosphoribosyltransferase [Gordonia aquimaris]MCX2963828.1 nicotinate-nucleotide--dimethylbenzimidazole phosphoribosyltransferase [Gordonia aquimaris]